MNIQFAVQLNINLKQVHGHVPTGNESEGNAKPANQADEICVGLKRFSREKGAQF